MPRPQFTLRALLVVTLVAGAFFAGRHFERRQRMVDREHYATSKDCFATNSDSSSE